MARLGAAWIVYTDIARDGMMIGPNWEGIAAFAQALQAPVIASGGISCLEDIHRLAELEPLGVVGAIVGRALYEGAFSLREALRAAGG
ncbi:MAG: hypothetical protein KatS3mg115_0150 [Candidatus Poribacteria bacterium]|nr:MAG: hypothetical protein KatS3mg115_0150 [Candidatus Poribacteria bacterium]